MVGSYLCKSEKKQITFQRWPRFLPPASPRDRDPYIWKHVVNANLTGFLLSKYEWFLIWVLCFCSVLCLLCFMRVCLYVLCGHLLGKGWPLGSRLWCLLCVCHFPIGILGQVWYLIVSIPDLCNLITFTEICTTRETPTKTLSYFLKMSYILTNSPTEGQGPWGLKSWCKCQPSRVTMFQISVLSDQWLLRYTSLEKKIIKNVVIVKNEWTNLPTDQRMKGKMKTIYPST